MQSRVNFGGSNRLLNEILDVYELLGPNLAFVDLSGCALGSNHPIFPAFVHMPKYVTAPAGNLCKQLATLPEEKARVPPGGCGVDQQPPALPSAVGNSPLNHCVKVEMLALCPHIGDWSNCQIRSPNFPSAPTFVPGGRTA